MFELNVKSYIKRNPRLRQAKMGMLMSKWAWNRKVCPRQFKRFFSSFTLPKTSALFASFLNTRRVAYSSANYGGRLGNQALHLPFLSWCPSGEVRPSSGRACLVSLCPK